MKIAMIGQKRIPSREGGVEIVVEELSTRLVNLGYEVICYNRSGKYSLDENINIDNSREYKGVKLIKCFTIDKKGLAALTSSFVATIKALFSKADVIHYHAEGPCVMIWIIKWFSKKRVIATIHGLDWQRAKWGGFASKYIKFGEKIAAKYADEIIVLSKNIQKYFKETYNRKTNYIPNGINEPTSMKPDIIRRKYNLKKDSYILFLGRLVPEKGVHYLIKAYQNLNTSKKLVIAGGSSDTNSYKEELISLANNNKNIIFTGFVEGYELAELYSNAYIYCLPSDLEGMPISLLEAMSYGNCCLVSNIPECTEVIEDKGLTFKKSNIKNLELELNKLLQNKKIIEKYQSQAQKYILEKYNWDDIVKKILKLYKDSQI